MNNDKIISKTFIKNTIPLITFIEDIFIKPQNMFNKNTKLTYDCIVLDLDGTLVFSSKKRKNYIFDISKQYVENDELLCKKFQILDDNFEDINTDQIKSHSVKFNNVCGENIELWVYKRPGFDIFLKKCFELTNVGVWSMGQPEYVEAIVSLFPQRPSFVYNWCDCDRGNGKIFKKLDNIPFQGNIIMIDDNINALELCSRIQTYIIPEWHPRQTEDNILYDLLPFLFGSLTK